MNTAGHHDSPGRGIGLMTAGLLLLTINDATAKWLTDSYPVPQIISLRGITILLPLALYFTCAAAWPPLNLIGSATRRYARCALLDRHSSSLLLSA